MGVCQRCSTISLLYFSACLVFISLQPRGRLRPPPAAHQEWVKKDMAISRQHL